MRKIKLTRANKSITLKALAPYYYQQRALGYGTQEVGKLILKIDSLPTDKKATFSTEEIFLMRTAINRLRNERLSKGQYTDAADDRSRVRIPYTIIVRLWRFYMGVTAFCWPLPFILVLLTYPLRRECSVQLS